MYLSRLVFDPWNREARRDLASAYELHKTLLSYGFVGVAKPVIGRVLFRVDADPPPHISSRWFARAAVPLATQSRASGLASRLAATAPPRRCDSHPATQRPPVPRRNALP